MASGEILSKSLCVRALFLALLVLLTGCGAAIESSGDTDAEQGGAAGAASIPEPADRACVWPDERGNVTPAGLSLAGYGCTEVVNRSGIVGARFFCCPVGSFATGTTEPDAGAQ